jgi:hypothetical protein
MRLDRQQPFHVEPYSTYTNTISWVSRISFIGSIPELALCIRKVTLTFLSVCFANLTAVDQLRPKVDIAAL